MYDKIIDVAERAISIRLGERIQEFKRIVDRMSADFAKRGISGSGVANIDIGKACNEEIKIRAKLVLEKLIRVVFSANTMPDSATLKAVAYKYIDLAPPDIIEACKRVSRVTVDPNIFRKSFDAARDQVGTEIDIMTLKEKVGEYQDKTTVEDWDLFISHAWEDKEVVAKPLAQTLIQEGYRVWYDDLTLTIGDSLRRSIDNGLSRSRFGVVILSPDFFKKDWPQKELDGLVAREIDSVKVILPVWHNVTKKDVLAYSPMLADRLGVSTANGLVDVVYEIKRAVGRPKG